MPLPNLPRGAGRGRVSLPIACAAMLLALSLSAMGIRAAWAQDEGGPTPEEIAQFEQEFTPPAENGPGEGQIERPTFEEPGQVPPEIKGQVPERDLVAIYCAMSKWKSGKFFAAMDALQNVVAPAMAKVTALGLGAPMPDPTAYKAEGQKRLDAICAASDSAAADRLVRDFMAWGQDGVFAKYADWRAQLRSKIEEFAAQMKADVKAQLDPFIEEKKSQISAEINAKAKELAAAKTSSLQSSKRQPTEAEIAAMKSEIRSQLQGLIDTRKAEVATAVQAKVREIMGDRQQQLEDIGTSFKGMEQKVNAAIADNAKAYDRYKDEADGLRKKMVLDLLDRKMADGLAELDAHAAEIDEARQQNPDVPSVGEVKSKLAEDRRALEAKLDAALKSGDETAFQNALADFRVRWETYRADMEKAAQQSVSKICNVAVAQLQQGQAQMAPGRQRIKDLLSSCAADTSERCQRVNEFSDRLGTLSTQLDQVELEMAAVQSMCQSPETADRGKLLGLLKQLQSDGAAVKTYGEALDAAKNEALAAGLKEMCAQALPQLQAAETEIAANDLTQITAKLAACKGKSTDECRAVLKLGPARDSLAGRISKFQDSVAAIRAQCASGGLPDIERASAILEGLKTEGEAMRADAKELKLQAAESASAAAFCKAVAPQLDLARKAAADGRAAAKKEQDSCAGQSDPRCQKIKEMASKFTALVQRIDALGSKIGEVLKYCATASTSQPPNAGMTAKAEEIRAEQDALPAAAAALKAEGEKAAADAAAQGKAFIWVEAEDENRIALLPHTEPWHSTKGKSTDSWRPPTFGSGYWYLSRGGEWLEYDIAAPAAGTYTLWIRDLASNVPGQEGKAVVTVSVDGKSLGSFAENEKGRSVPYPKGAFYWHKTASVTLKAGKHVLRVTKQATTSRAAILDAYYLTTGTDTPAEK